VVGQPLGLTLRGGAYAWGPHMRPSQRLLRRLNTPAVWTRRPNQRVCLGGTRHRCKIEQKVVRRRAGKQSEETVKQVLQVFLIQPKTKVVGKETSFSMFV